MNITAIFASQNNLVLPLSQSPTGATIRVASNSSATLGTFSTTDTNVLWTIAGNPSWVSLVVNPTNSSQISLIYSNAQEQADPYQFYITGISSNGTSYFPISLEVREPFSIAAVGGNTSFSMNSYDSTVTDVVIQGIGLNGVVDADVSFLPPTNLPPGLFSITSDGSSLKLRVAHSTATNIPGGITLNTGSPESTQFNIQAYKPGTMYDTPARCFTQAFTVQSLIQKAGVLDVGLAVYYDTTNNVFKANAYLDYLQGAPLAGTTYEWDITGIAGTISSGGGSSDKFVIWTPTASGSVTFTFKVKNSLGAVIAQQAVTGVNSSSSANWTSTSAIKLNVDAPVKTGYIGDVITFTVSTPASEFNAGEVITVTPTIVGVSSLEGVASVSPSTITLNAGSNSGIVTVTVPSSGWNQKWLIHLSAQNSVSSPTRTGSAQAVLESNSTPPLTLNIAGGNTLTAVTGVAIAPITLSTTNRSTIAVTSTYELAGAPDGLFISGNTILGTLLTPGSYTFHVVASASGYAYTISSAITLTVTQAIAPLAIGTLSSSTSSLPDGQPYNIQWSITGQALDLNLYQNFTKRGVLGATQATLSQIGNSVIALTGTSFYGTAYTSPILVLSSSIVSQGRLLNAPTVGVIDENFNLQLNWNPLTVEGSYSAYKDWNIWLTALPNGTPQLQSLPTGLPTGLEVAGSTLDSRIYKTQLSSGDYTVTMQALSADYTKALDATPWDSPHEFPVAITAASVTFDNTTLDLGQTLTITLDPTYVGSNSWRVNFADNTSTGWLPLSIKTVSKVFLAAGSQNIVVQTSNDYTSASPSVRLNRQVTKSVFVLNQQYQGPANSTATTSVEGFGGEAGFEITDNTQNGSGVTLPFMVINRSLIRDTTTNELKVLVATSRTSDASSIYGTMAIDVFPLQGRPHIQDLVEIPETLITGTTQSLVPVVIATKTLPNLIVGKTMSDFVMQVAPSSGTSPYSWYTDELPLGLSMSIDGTITGTPQSIFNGTVRFSVTDSSNPPFIATTVLPLTVLSDLAISSTQVPGAVVMTPYSFPIQFSGGIAPYTWSIVSGGIPQGLSLDPNSGIISGVPVTYNSTTDFAKPFSAVVQVVDSIGAMAAVTISTTLSPAPLQIGNVDQPNVFAGSNYKLVAPVFGGISPYTLSSFSDDGVVGSGLVITNPTKLHAVAGVNSSALTILTSNQTFYPATYPYGLALTLSAQNGVAPYRFLLSTNSNNTLPGAAIYGDALTAFPTQDGTYNVTITCVDSVGHTASKTLTVATQQKNVGAYTIKPVSIATNSSTNPGNWTVTPIAALPDAATGTAYVPAAGSYYGLALYQNNVLHMTQNSGNPNPMSFTVRSGSLPSGIATNSGNGFGSSTDYSGIVVFNAFGGAYPSVLGESSFEVEFSNIQTSSGTVAQAVARESITVVSTAGTTTSVVVAIDPSEITLNLSSVSGTTYNWFLPLVAEGGTAPYNFSLQSSSTLPGSIQAASNGLPVLTAKSLSSGTYTALIVATDSNGIASAPITLTVNVVQSQSLPIHIVSSNIPTYAYANSTLPANTYYVEADGTATWSATGLPAGISISSTAGTRAYLQGAATVSGTFSFSATAVSVLYGTSVSSTYTFAVRPRSAVIVNKPTSATVGVAYSVVNNNAILTVQYTGYQPGDSTLPVLSSANGQVGAPGVLQNGYPTTEVRSLTTDGFTLDYNYLNTVAGTDTVTLGSGLDTCSIVVSQPALVVTGTTTTSIVSEYAVSANFAAPVSISGGLAPYTTVFSGISDPRFTIQGTGIVMNPSQFQAGQTYTCSVAMTVTDSSGQTASATGYIQVTVHPETYDTITFSNVNWNVNVSSDTPFTATLEPNQKGSVPVLGHAPYQYYVDSVTLPSGLTGFVNISASKRVLAIQYNDTNTSAVVSDVGPNLAVFGSFTVPAVGHTSAPAPGTYTIPCTLRVVDANSISTIATISVLLTIS